eukprot:6466038-Amphidinium_carterae.1
MLVRPKQESERVLLRVAEGAEKPGGRVLSPPEGERQNGERGANANSSGANANSEPPRGCVLAPLGEERVESGGRDPTGEDSSTFVSPEGEECDGEKRSASKYAGDQKNRAQLKYLDIMYFTSPTDPGAGCAWQPGVLARDTRSKSTKKT